jgi:hypothetical protein
MLQRGIETPDMDVRWVSSLSWYFLNFFGLNGLYRLILGSDNCGFYLCFLPSSQFKPFSRSGRLFTGYDCISVRECYIGTCWPTRLQ